MKNRIKELFNTHSKAEIVHLIEQEHIFGPTAENEHLKIEDIASVYDEVLAEQPVVEVE